MFGELHFPRADQKALLAIVWCPRDQLPKAKAVLNLSCPYPRLCCTMSLFSTALPILRTFLKLKNKLKAFPYKSKAKKQTKSF